MKKKIKQNYIYLEEYNKQLERRVQEELSNNKKKDRMMFQQNKFAALGEMLGNIAHQWRQPLMEINSLFLPLEAKIHLGDEVKDSELLDSIEKMNVITSYMSKTIDDFRNFFADEKEKIEFVLLEQINSTVNIISSGLKKNDIRLNIIIQKNPVMLGYKNEYSQVLINIINNARDILVQRRTLNPHIKISIFEDNNNIVTIVEDNGGGIKIEPIDKVFEPFFTYDKKDGSGIGLFMSKLIVENNMNGRLLVENTQNGALFKIIIPKV